ncbi:glycoside hydrolase family 3 C-terminal domain-containing protein [Bacteroides ovatus]|uniref:glycoside hydrolase family 3 C-terminal domain-containing protein n=1 Tax=Bacteroides ovatus TaxID=28116 RepID=UPI00321ADA73
MKRSCFIILFSWLVIISNAQNVKILPVYLDENKHIEERVEDALSRMTIREKINIIHAQAKFSSAGVPRLGIPELWHSDGPHGVRMEIAWNSWEKAGWTNDSCTAFPALTCLSATFDPDMALLYGRTIGAEARYRKKDILLGPGINICRIPLNGRNFEYMGEDPYLASKMCVPYIKGVQENGVAACVKHYALNNQEKWRNESDVQISDRALFEIYLPAFKAAVQKGGVWTLMGAYNKYQGQYCTHNQRLMNHILKGNWGFDGVVISDWGSTHDLKEAILNGLDLEMGTGTNGLSTQWGQGYDAYYLAVPFLKLIEKGEIPISVLDEKVRRVLRLMFRTVMNRNRSLGSLASPEHAEIARKIASQGIVLLKNADNFFPIPVDRYKRILIVGENATKTLTVGGGSSELKVKKEVSPLEGLQNRYGKENIIYARGYSTEQGDNNEALKREALEKAEKAEVVIYIGGLNKNSYQDCEGVDRNVYQMPGEQNDLIEELLRVNKNMGVILISGNAVSMPWVEKVPALIQSWYLGSEAGNATADVVSGEINPSGKLPFSIPKRLEDNGAISYGESSYPGDEKNGKKTYYMEDILVGYRWHDTKKIPALFAFGHGMSYTTFKYGRVLTDKEEYEKTDEIKISVALTNNGNMAGSEVVQIYVSQHHPSMPRPLKELKAFKKIYLKPGKSQVVNLNIPVKELAFYDDKKQEWVVESDKFTIYCASSSVDIKDMTSIKIK